MLTFENGFQGSIAAGGGNMPSSNATENDVVFGGIKTLDNLIKSTLKIYDGDLFVVLTGCTGELIGDNVPDLVGKYQKAGYPIVYANTAGFKGNNIFGHETVVDAIIDQFVGNYEGEKKKGLVNLWFEVPYYNQNWRGDYQELARILRGAGLEVNVLFGPENPGVEAWKRIPQAQFNLLVSPWVGLKNMKTMEKKLDIPYLHYPVLPIGATETGKFLREVGKFAHVDEAKVEEVIKKHEDYFYYLISRYADLFLENRVINKQFTVVADAQYSLAITKFLVNDLGLIPAKQFVTDDTPKEHHEAIAAEFQNLNYGIKADVAFETDGFKIHEEIKSHDYHGYPLVLGGYYEKEVTEKLKGNYLNISWPVLDKVVFDDFYVGYTGGIRLIEDIYTVAVQRFN